MATSAKTSMNPLHAALPTLFNRMGDPRRVKGFRGNNSLLSRAARTEKALMSPAVTSITVFQANCALVLDHATTKLLQECSVDGLGAISALILNGFDVVVSSREIAGEVMDFRLQRGLDRLSQGVISPEFADLDSAMNTIGRDILEGED